MKKQLNQLRRFFARTGTRKLNAATAREVIPASYDDDDGSNRLSGAFVVVLLLHVVALVGVFAFTRMKDAKPVAEAAVPASHPAPAAPAQRSASPALPEPTPELPAVPSTAVNSTAAARNAALAQTEAAIVNERIAHTPRPTQTTSGRTHVVKSGQTLGQIALANGLRSTDIMEANGLKSSELKAGQELVIPERKVAKTAEAKPSEKTTASKSAYTVRKGDSLIKIARSLGVKYEDLAKVNNIQDPGKLREGQVLKVPSKG